MSSKKALTIFSLILVVGMLVTACAQPTPAPAATQAPAATTAPAAAPAAAAGSKMICVIVPPVENPFFGAMQEIAAKKAEAVGLHHPQAEPR